MEDISVGLETWYILFTIFFKHFILKLNFNRLIKKIFGLIYNENYC